MFIVLTSADVHGVKKNLELGFDVIPTLAELAKRISDAFTVERKMGRQHGYPVEPFSVTRLDVYDESKKRWVRLVSATQLVEWCQIFAIPADEVAAAASSPLSVRAAAAAAAASTAGSPNSGGGTPHGHTMLPASRMLSSRLPKSPSQWTDNGHPSVPNWAQKGGAGNSKAAAVFEEFDVSEKGYLTQEDFLRVFDVNYMGVGKATVYDLFQSADADKDGRVSWYEFIPFYEAHPKLMASVYYRTRQYWNDFSRRKESSDVSELLDFHKLKAKKAHDELHAAQADIAELEGYIDQRKKAFRDAPEVEREQEQILLEQQAKLRQMHERILEEEGALESRKREFSQRHGRAPGSASPSPRR